MRIVTCASKHYGSLVIKFSAVDGSATSAIAPQEITSLQHEAINNSVNDAAFVASWLAVIAFVLTSAKLTEVFCRSVIKLVHSKIEEDTMQLTEELHPCTVPSGFDPEVHRRLQRRRRRLGSAFLTSVSKTVLHESL